MTSDARPEIRPETSPAGGAGARLDARLEILVEAARSKKAFRIQLLDVSGISSFTETLAFMSGGSDRQNRAIADAVEELLKERLGERPFSVEGARVGNWILMDYGDFVVHVMDDDTRRFYNLEGLWAAGSELELPPELPEVPQAPKDAPSI